MASNDTPNGLNVSGQKRLRTGLVGACYTGTAVAIMAFLIPFAVLESCSQINIAIFILGFAASALLSLTGAALTIVSTRRDRLSYMGIILLAVYLVQLVALWRLMG